MQFFRPLSTLAVGVAIGYFLLPKALKMSPIGNG
jgi:hypothetical protein